MTVSRALRGVFTFVKVVVIDDLYPDCPSCSTPVDLESDSSRSLGGLGCESELRRHWHGPGHRHWHRKAALCH